MTIIYLHQYFKFPNQRGSTRSYDLAVELAKRGYNIIVISSSKNKDYQKKLWNKIQHSDKITIFYMYN